jgi:hypothetical protein
VRPPRRHEERRARRNAHSLFTAHEVTSSGDDEVQFILAMRRLRVRADRRLELYRHCAMRKGLGEPLSLGPLFSDLAGQSSQKLPGSDLHQRLLMGGWIMRPNVEVTGTGAPAEETQMRSIWVFG